MVNFNKLLSRRRNLRKILTWNRLILIMRRKSWVSCQRHWHESKKTQLRTWKIFKTNWTLLMKTSKRSNRWSISRKIRSKLSTTKQLKALRRATKSSTSWTFNLPPRQQRFKLQLLTSKARQKRSRNSKHPYRNYKLTLKPVTIWLSKRQNHCNLASMSCRLKLRKLPLRSCRWCKESQKLRKSSSPSLPKSNLRKIKFCHKLKPWKSSQWHWVTEKLNWKKVETKLNVLLNNWQFFNPALLSWIFKLQQKLPKTHRWTKRNQKSKQNTRSSCKNTKILLHSWKLRSLKLWNLRQWWKLLTAQWHQWPSTTKKSKSVSTTSQKLKVITCPRRISWSKE